MELHREKDPVSSQDFEGLLQHSSCLPPVGVLAEGADADLLVQVDVVPEGNGSYSACSCGLDLGIKTWHLRKTTLILGLHPNTAEILNIH